MTTLYELFPSPYLVGRELPEGWRKTVAIKQIYDAEVFNPQTNKPEQKHLIRFDGLPKPAILNITIGRQIAAATGTIEVNEWVGKQVTLYRTVERSKRSKEMIAVVRVAEKTEAETKPQPKRTEWVEELDEKMIEQQDAQPPVEPARPPLQLGASDLPKGPGVDVPSAHKSNGNGEAPKPAPTTYQRPKSPMSAVQRRKLIELYRNLHGGDELAAQQGIDNLLYEQDSVTMKDASYEQAAHLTAQLLAAQRARS